MLIGGAAAACYLQWTDWRYASAGFLLSIAWLVADGLDGMVARATGTSSAFGRFMDGLCDHGVFFLLYFALAISIGTFECWLLGAAAALAHGIQSNLYETERYRFHQRLRGEPAVRKGGDSANLLVRAYDALGASLGSTSRRFDQLLAIAPHRRELIEDYAVRAVPAFAVLRCLSANVRIGVIYLACLLGDPKLFWWFEILPLSGIAAYGIIRHRRIETALISENTNAEAAGRVPADELERTE